MISFTKKEIFILIIAILISSFVIGHSNKKLEITLSTILIPIIIIPFHVIIKKIAGRYFSIKIEHKFWEISQYGFYSRSRLKKPFPIGAFISFFISIFSFGLLKVFTILEFDVKNWRERRILRKVGDIKHRRREINEKDIGFSAAIGFYSLIVLSILAFVLAFIFKDYKSICLFFLGLSKYSVYYGISNLIPISNLDGAKVFFGSLFNWYILVCLYIIFFIFAVLI